MIELSIETLSHEAFAPFGEVIEADPLRTQFAINAGTSQRFHDLARLDPGKDGRLTVSIFRSQPRDLPLSITMLERHPKGSQAFMPLSGKPFLVVVAPAGDKVDPHQIRAFWAHGQQGINFTAGTWHHPLLALHSESDFLVIDRADPASNCEEYLLEQRLSLNMELLAGVNAC
ncbi:MAG: ureidoglycolate lyase [Formivibrio sp.]|nr:ureidoglycolate lyase [Formivibrio sp.]